MSQRSAADGSADASMLQGKNHTPRMIATRQTAMPAMKLRTDDSRNPRSFYSGWLPCATPCVFSWS